jgi:chlorobactene glucosyltransferase
VIIPARNEERVIEATVRALLAQTYADLEVIVVDDHSSDSTAAILDRLGTEHPRLRVVRGADTPPGWLGKPWALHQGSAASRGELLLFVDADVHYEPDTVGRLVAALGRSSAAMLTVFPRVVMHGVGEHLGMTELAMAGFGFLPTWLGNHVRTPILGVGGGTGNLIRRADYAAIGGHESLRNAVIDDIGLARLTRRSGRMTIAIRAARFVHLRMYHGLREVIDGFSKNVYTAFGGTIPAALAGLLGFLFFHLGPYLGLLEAAWRFAHGAPARPVDLLWIASVLLIATGRVILFRSLRYPLVNALFGYPFTVLIWIWILLRSTWLVGIRGTLAWRGRSYDSDDTRFGGD